MTDEKLTTHVNSTQHPPQKVTAKTLLRGLSPPLISGGKPKDDDDPVDAE